MPCNLSEFPAEVVCHILELLEPRIFPAIRLVCRRFDELHKSLNWRHLCWKHYKYWDPIQGIGSALCDRTSKVDWRLLFAERQRTEHITTSLLDSVLATQVGRTEKIQRIVELGYNAKDTLLRHIAADDDAEDVLARRYYSDMALGSLHRTIAVKEWARLKDHDGISLARCLAAFDMFVLHGREGDMDETESLLENIALNVVQEPSWGDAQTPRQRALFIARYLRGHGLIGRTRHRTRYHDLHNGFIGIALRDPSHPSLPLISSTIFCCVAQRLGLDANPCLFPYHAISVVRPSERTDLDSQPVSDGSQPDHLYLDPFQSGDEIPTGSLGSYLQILGEPQSHHATSLSPSTLVDIVLRNGRNLLKSVEISHRQAMVRPSDQRQSTSCSKVAEADALYGALWALFLLAPADRETLFPHLAKHFASHFPTDASLIETHGAPLLRSEAAGVRLQGSVRALRQVDAIQKSVKRRTPERARRIRYKVGQVFKHKRFESLAVIIGWDDDCTANKQTHGESQNFYRVLTEDNTVGWVAEDSIQVVNPDTPGNGLLDLAGRHFKRWDRASSSFVSNMKDEYPDD